MQRTFLFQWFKPFRVINLRLPMYSPQCEGVINLLLPINPPLRCHQPPFTNVSAQRCHQPSFADVSAPEMTSTFLFRCLLPWGGIKLPPLMYSPLRWHQPSYSNVSSTEVALNFLHWCIHPWGSINLLRWCIRPWGSINLPPLMYPPLRWHQPSSANVSVPIYAYSPAFL